MTPDKIIKFWFEENGPEAWYRKSAEFDQEIRDRFTDIHGEAASGELSEWMGTAKGRLAEIIVLDQFSRNMFRDKPESFAYDDIALERAKEAISMGDDKKLNTTQRAFLYMPYMHSESLAIHEEAVTLFSKPGLENNLDYEYKHKDIIEKFGRYPHRNAILGRDSTPEEMEFLKQENSSF